MELRAVRFDEVSVIRRDLLNGNVELDRFGDCHR